MAVQSPHQVTVYAEVSDAPGLEGYGDLLTGQTVDMAEADARAAQERRVADIE